MPTGAMDDDAHRKGSFRGFVCLFFSGVVFHLWVWKGHSQSSESEVSDSGPVHRCGRWKVALKPEERSRQFSGWRHWNKLSETKNVITSIGRSSTWSNGVNGRRRIIGRHRWRDLVAIRSDSLPNSDVKKNNTSEEHELRPFICGEIKQSAERDGYFLFIDWLIG